jgi:hypothetical protein
MANNPIVTPQQMTITASSSSALDTAVLAEVNTLIKQYVNPKQNTGLIASGTVENGSIVVSQTRAVATTNNAVTWYATIQWSQFIAPE